MVRDPPSRCKGHGANKAEQATTWQCCSVIPTSNETKREESQLGDRYDISSTKMKTIQQTHPNAFSVRVAGKSPTCFIGRWSSHECGVRLAIVRDWTSHYSSFSRMDHRRLLYGRLGLCKSNNQSWVLTVSSYYNVAPLPLAATNVDYNLTHFLLNFFALSSYTSSCLSGYEGLPQLVLPEYCQPSNIFQLKPLTFVPIFLGQ